MGIMIGVSCVELICTVAQSYTFVACGAKLTKRVKLRMFKSMLKQEMAFHDRLENQPSILSTKLTNDAALLKGLTTDKLALFCQAVSGIGSSLILAFILNWKLSLVMLAFVPVTLLAGKFSSQTQTKSKKSKNPIDECGRLTTEVILIRERCGKSVLFVKISNKQRFFLMRLHNFNSVAQFAYF